jgi:RNA polymerase sigma-70 factor (ECF subfamily)
MTARERDAKFNAGVLACLPQVARCARHLARDRADGDDLYQETYLRAGAGWATFEPGRDYRKWLFAICRNIFLRQMRQARSMVSAGGVCKPPASNYARGERACVDKCA